MHPSSSCTGVTVGNTKGQIKELITFERETRKGETAGVYLAKLEQWVKTLISTLNIKCYAIEETIKTQWVNSDKVTKQVRGVLVNVYQTAKCIDENGDQTYLTDNAEIEEVNNQEWKSM